MVNEGVESKVEILDVDEFLTGAQKMSIGRDVHAHMQRERDKQVIDPDSLRDVETYSNINDIGCRPEDCSNPAYR